MESLKSPARAKAEIYRNIFQGKVFMNPMTGYILSLKHKLGLKYNSTESETLKEHIKILFELLDYFKSYTDDISGGNMNSTKKIYDIMDAINIHLSTCNDNIDNLYKQCLSSILDADDLIEIFSKIENQIVNDDTDDIISSSIDMAVRNINAHIQADKLAYANLKQESLLCSIRDSLSNVVKKTKDNIEMYAG